MLRKISKRAQNLILLDFRALKNVVVSYLFDIINMSEYISQVTQVEL
jgi:hypothetical protein